MWYFRARLSKRNQINFKLCFVFTAIICIHTHTWAAIPVMYCGVENKNKNKVVPEHPIKRICHILIKNLYNQDVILYRCGDNPSDKLLRSCTSGFLSFFLFFFFRNRYANLSRRRRNFFHIITWKITDRLYLLRGLTRFPLWLLEWAWAKTLHFVLSFIYFFFFCPGRRRSRRRWFNKNNQKYTQSINGRQRGGITTRIHYYIHTHCPIYRRVTLLTRGDGEVQFQSITLQV